MMILVLDVEVIPKLCASSCLVVGFRVKYRGLNNYQYYFGGFLVMIIVY